MSTFSGLNTAASALSAARRGMDLVGQNIANENTPGYTRQRLNLSAVPPLSHVGRFSAGAVPGNGVSVDGIARLGDALLDARVRDSLAASGYWSTRAVIATTAEAALAEPTENGLAARLGQFWAGWQDVANAPDSGAASSVILESATQLAAHLADGYRSVAQQWNQVRAGAESAVTQINASADQIAALNREIRDATAAGRNINELIDQRALIAQNVARLSGATARLEEDGSMTLRIGGNALVSGADARHLALSGPTSLESTQRMTVTWISAPDLPVDITDGELAGRLSALAGAAEGGTLAQLAAQYNAVATALAESVNAQHRAGVTAAGDPGGDFFGLAGTGPAALGLSVVARADQLALAEPGKGAWDTGNADAISQIAARVDSPDRLWAHAVSAFGVATAADIQRARLAESAAVTATSAQLSVSAVDGDEETLDLLTYQTAYQAAARVITAVDEALDVLINRMGVVGR